MSGWRFWPEPEPVGPGGYSQRRWARPYRPGLPRVLTALLLGFCAALVAGVGMLAGWAQPAPIGRLIGVAGAVAAAASLGWLAGRVFAAGIWVTDSAVRILGVVADVVAPWSSVVDITEIDGARLLGLPVTLGGRTVVVHLSDGTRARTPLTSLSPDFLGRPEPYRQAAGAIRRWWWECR